MENETNMNAQFETGKSYGNDLTLEIVKRTAKTATIKTVFGEQRVKIKVCTNRNIEYISFKCWLIDSTDDFNEEDAQQVAMENAYYS